MIRVPHVLLLIGQSPSSQPLAPVVLRRVAQPSRIFASLSWHCHPTIHSAVVFLHLKILCNLTALFSDALDALFQRQSPSTGVWAASSNICGGARFHFYSLRRDAAKDMPATSADTAQHNTTHTPHTTEFRSSFLRLHSTLPKA
jgi:hypothetical protein